MKRTFHLFSIGMIFAFLASLVGMPAISVHSQSMLEHVPLSLPTGWSNGYLYDVWGSSTNDVYAVGHANDETGNPVPLLYRNDGTGWTEASPSLLSGWQAGHLYGVWASGAGGLYVVGEGPTSSNGMSPLLYYNDGTRWTDAALSLPPEWSIGVLIDVWGSSTSDIYAVGWGSHGTLIYHNDGTGWRDVSSALPASGDFLHGVWGSGADDVYVVGNVGDDPLIYHNDGTGWTDVSPSLPAGWSFGDLYGVGGSSASDVYAVGWGSHGSLIYHNDGTGWIYTSPSLPAGWDDGYLHNIWGSSASNVYAVGYSYSGGLRPLLYYNNGTSWTDVSPSLPPEWSSGYLHGVWGSGAGDLYMVGEGYNPDDGTLPLLYQRGATTLMVTNTNDSGAGSLRQAIIDAASGDIITFDPSLAGGVIQLSVPLSINKDLMIDGSGLSPQVVLSGGDTTGIIQITDFAQVTISDLTFTDGFSSNGGAIDNTTGILTIINSTLKENHATGNGGAIYNSGMLTLENSTINQNQADGVGGAIAVTVNGISCCTITNSTISRNQAGAGGAISFVGNVNSIIANVTVFQNQGVESGGAFYMHGNVSVDVDNSTFADNNSPQGSALFRMGNGSMSLYNTILLCKPDNSNCIVQSGTFGIGNVNSIIDVGTLSDFGLAELAHNGGPTQTMALLPRSPLIDAGDDTNCPTTDQRGVTRPQGSQCDIGAFEYEGPFPATPTPSSTSTPTNTATPTSTNTPTPTNTATPTSTPPYSYRPLYLSLTGNQTVGGVASADEDILKFDGQNWSLLFDGSDVSVGGTDLSGFTLLDSDSILMAFNNAITLGGLAIAPQDIVRFEATSLGSTTAGTFSMYLDGSDVGLDVSAEKIDSVSLLPDGRVLISTTGNPAVAGITGGRDEDVLAFTPTSLGSNTSGMWAIYFDGSDVGVAETSGEDIDALDVAGGKIYLSTLDNFSVSGMSGADEDIFVCEPTSLGDITACNYSPSLYFDGSTWGLSANDVDAFNFLTAGPVPTSTPTGTPTSPPTLTKTFTPSPTVTATFTPTLTTTPPTSMYVRVTQPNGGEVLTVGSTYRITWDSTSDIDKVTIGYKSCDSCLDWIANNIPNVGYYDWTVNVGNTTNTQFKIDITGYDTGVGSVIDRSDDYFTVLQPTPTPSATATFTPTGTPDAVDLIFADGFESGDLSAWTSSTTDAGDLSVIPSAALQGSQGLQAVIDDNNTIYITDDSPSAESRYRARFYFDPNSIPMANGDAHFIFKGFMGTSTQMLQVELRFFSGTYQLRAKLMNDNSAFVSTNWFPISDASHFIELGWRAASSAGANNGGLTFWIDGIQQADLTGVDNDTWRIDRIRLGAVAGVETGTRGSYYFDAFQSHRQNYIGP